MLCRQGRENATEHSFCCRGPITLLVLTSPVTALIRSQDRRSCFARSGSGLPALEDSGAFEGGIAVEDGSVEVLHDGQLVPRIEFGDAGIAAIAFAHPDFGAAHDYLGEDEFAKGMVPARLGARDDAEVHRFHGDSLGGRSDGADLAEDGGTDANAFGSLVIHGQDVVLADEFDAAEFLGKAVDLAAGDERNGFRNGQLRKIDAGIAFEFDVDALHEFAIGAARGPIEAVEYERGLHRLRKGKWSGNQRGGGVGISFVVECVGVHAPPVGRLLDEEGSIDGHRQAHRRGI